MLSVLQNCIFSIINGTAAQADDTYKILFYSLLGLIVLSVAAWLIYKMHKKISLFFRDVFSLIKTYTSKAYVGLKGIFTGSIAGFAYSKDQDIFYSTHNAWQRSFGYSRLYDEAAAHFAMIVDSEPVYFDYDGKRWLIEFWKGQYGMTTGCEVGIYNTDRPAFQISGIFDETFYNSASDDDMLFISYTLFKNGRKLFQREGIHWWLTGFRLGEFSHPSELAMDVSITLKDKYMLNAFMHGMRNIGYSDDDMFVNGHTVSFVFDKPHSPQPQSRTKEIENFMQSFNKQNCDIFQELTGDYQKTSSKLVVIRKQNPEIFNSILNLGGSRKVPYKHGVLKKF